MSLEFVSRIQQITSMVTSPASLIPLGGFAPVSTSAPEFGKAYESALQTVGASTTPGATERPSTNPVTSSALDWSAPTSDLPPGTPYADLFQAAATRNGLSPKLLAAVADVESRFHRDSVSPVGAQGLMQFMPATANGMGVDPWDPASAIDGAARLLAGHLQRFGTIESALAAYNVGSGAVAQSGGTVPSSARDYVDAVMARVHGGIS